MDVKKTKKKILIDMCYKVLCAYEGYENGKGSLESYQSCIRTAVVALSSQQDTEAVLNSIVLLNGLFNMGAKTRHEDVRRVVLHVTNEIGRKVEEVL